MNVFSLIPAIVWVKILEFIWTVKIDIDITVLALFPTTIATLFIPIAIFLVEDARTDLIDRNVLVEKVLRLKLFFLYLVLGLFSLFLYNSHPLIAVIYIVSLVILSASILNGVAKWVKIKNEKGYESNYRQLMRTKYLSSLKSYNEIYRTWETILTDNNFKNKNQAGVVEALLSSTDRIINGDAEKYMKEDFLRLYTRNIDKFNFYNLGDYRALVQFALGYFEDLEKEHEVSKWDGTMLRERYNLTLALLRVQKDMEVPGDGEFAQIFFEELDRGIARGKIDLADITKWILQEVANIFSPDSASLRLVWEENDFFRRIELNPESKNDKSKNRLLVNYLTMIADGIFDTKSADSIKEGLFIDTLTELIFKEIDPITWFKYLALSFIVYKKDGDPQWADETVNRWCELSRKYGLRGRASDAYHGVLQNDNNNQLQKYFEQIAQKEQEATLKTLLNLGLITNYDDEESMDRLKKAAKKAKKKIAKDRNGNEKLDKISELERIVVALDEYQLRSNPPYKSYREKRTKRERKNKNLPS